MIMLFLILLDLYNVIDEAALVDVTGGSLVDLDTIGGDDLDENDGYYVDGVEDAEEEENDRDGVEDAEEEENDQPENMRREIRRRGLPDQVELLSGKRKTRGKHLRFTFPERICMNGTVIL